jgi:signal transduction histidine kinase/FixJ family two-component response regulator
MTDLVGKSDTDLFPSEVARQFAEAGRAALADNQTVEVATSAPNAQGKIFHWVAFLFPLADSSESRCLGGIVLDLTERKRTEEALHVAEGQFRQALIMEAVGQLAGGVAHDFNNLLTVILGYAEMLLYSRLSGDERARGPLLEIHKAGERATSLTRQLLAFSRKQILAPKVIDLNHIVSDMDKMLRRLIGEDISLTAVLDRDLQSVKADPGQIEQVLLNLAVNARDAMPQGGNLTIETRNTYLDELYAQTHVEVQPGHYVMLAVSDTGCGMDATTQARIFEPFFTTKGPDRGTGLGLATVFGIVKQSEGHIWVYSEPGQGTCFKIFLRCHIQPTNPKGKSVLGSPQSPKGQETVLLVEDEDGVRGLARHVLEEQGYTVLEASRGAEALRLCQEHPATIDVLVTDVVMPEMSGRQLAERLAQIRPGLKVLYMSGYTTDAVVRHGVLEAEKAFLQKPFSSNALACKVREVLDQANVHHKDANRLERLACVLS